MIRNGTAKSSITVLANLEQAWMFLLAAEKASKMFHYPEELRERIALLKRATVNLRLRAMSVTEENTR